MHLVYNKKTLMLVPYSTYAFTEVIMKQLRKVLCLAFILVMSTSCLFGCGGKEVVCPFTEIKWENTVEDIFALEGENYEEGESLYYGDSYVYPKEYKGYNGTIQYMFDEKDKLACMVWLYSSESHDEVFGLYEEITKELTDEYGEGGLDSAFASQVGGNVWYLDGGNIILMASLVDEYKAVQFSFVSPKHSLDE